MSPPTNFGTYLHGPSAMLGKVPVTFELFAEKSIVRQEDYGKDWMLRFAIIPVIPSLIKKPLC